jgi:hypothetical protein
MTLNYAADDVDVAGRLRRSIYLAAALYGLATAAMAWAELGFSVRFMWILSYGEGTDWPFAAVSAMGGLLAVAASILMITACLVWRGHAGASRLAIVAAAAMSILAAFEQAAGLFQNREWLADAGPILLTTELIRTAPQPVVPAVFAWLLWVASPRLPTPAAERR